MSCVEARGHRLISQDSLGEWRLNEWGTTEDVENWGRDLLVVNHYLNREWQDCLDKVHTKVLVNDAATKAGAVGLGQEKDNWRLQEGGEFSCGKLFISADYDFGSMRRNDTWAMCSGPLVEDTAMRDSFAGRMSAELYERVTRLLGSPALRTPYIEPLEVVPTSHGWP